MLHENFRINDMFINVVEIICVISTTNSLILEASYMQQLVNPAWRPDRFEVKMSTTFVVWINLPNKH